MSFSSPLLPADFVRRQLPLAAKELSALQTMRGIAAKICSGEDARIPIIVGPCSVHSTEGILLYAKFLRELQKEVKDSFYLVLRVYVEKARTTIGWKGFLYDPFLSGASDIAEGIYQSRKLLLDLLELHIPCAMEFVNPLIVNYFQDLLTWGFIGARTASSQIHRELASALEFPIGFKNSIDGNLEVAVNGIIASRVSQTFLGIDDSGTIASFSSRGNPHTHLVLRGSSTRPNYDRNSIEHAVSLQDHFGIHSKIMVDCAHGNSNKNVAKQKEVFYYVMAQIVKGNPYILGIMLESFLEAGNQLFTMSEKLSPYLSITDPCLSFQETKEIILWAHTQLTSLSPPTSTVSTCR